MVWDKKVKSVKFHYCGKPNGEEVADVYNGATPSTVNELNYGGDIVWITPRIYLTKSRNLSIKESEISLKLDMILVVLICYLQTQY